jgi:excinuclease UvrABC nuclease subunit
MSINISKIKKLPDTPGVYFFLGKNKKILYIGKATSLRSRVKSYLVKDISTVRSPLIAQMMDTASSIDFKSTDSVLEALILEADLIRKFKPEFNTREKDDKSFCCVVITKEDFPVVKLARKKDIDFEKCELDTLQGSEKLKAIYGPYPESVSIKEGLKIIRKIFPYRDEKCHILPRSKPCFNYQISLCPGTCVGKISKHDYAYTIRNIELFFKGKKSKLISILNKEMREVIKEERFEDAAKKRNQIYALEHIRDVSLIKQETTQSKEIILQSGNNILPAFRMEAYDIAHMGGKNMVGVMVVMEDGEFVKNEYRKFIIRGFDSSNDTGALQETLSRRMNHANWRYPSIIIVDGGSAQLNAAQKTIPHTDIQIVSVVKDDKHKARDIFGNSEYTKRYEREIIQLNAEAHRYAIAFHKQRRNKDFLPK